MKNKSRSKTKLHTKPQSLLEIYLRLYQSIVNELASRDMVYKAVLFREDFPFVKIGQVCSILLYVDDVVAAATIVNALGIVASDGLPLEFDLNAPEDAGPGIYILRESHVWHPYFGHIILTSDEDTVVDEDKIIKTTVYRPTQ